MRSQYGGRGTTVSSIELPKHVERTLEDRLNRVLERYKLTSPALKHALERMLAETWAEGCIHGRDGEKPLGTVHPIRG